MRHRRNLARLVAVVAITSASACKTWQRMRALEPGLTPPEVAKGHTAAAAQAFPEVQPGTRVRIRAATVVDGRVTGKIVGRAAESFVVDGESGGEFTVPFAALSELSVSHGVSHARGALTGAMWGGGLGLGVGLVFTAVPNSERKSQSGFTLGPPTAAQGVLLGASGGLLIGSALGALQGSEQWERLRLPASIALVPVRRGVGLRFTLGR